MFGKELLAFDKRKEIPIEDYGHIKVLPSGTKDVTVDGISGGMTSIELKIKNKTDHDWPSKLEWWNNYSKTSEKIPYILKECEELKLTMTFIIPRNFIG